MKNLTLFLVVTMISAVLSSCASNKTETKTTTTTTSSTAPRQQGTGLPSEMPHGSMRPSN